MPYQPTQNYYYQPTTTQIRQPLIGLKGRPVSGLEEVRAAAVDFDGTVSFFPDLANGKIYTKQCTTNPDSSKAMKDLESYMQDLTSDMIEMLDKATPEERAVVQKKINILAAKIQNV